MANPATDDGKDNLSVYNVTFVFQWVTMTITVESTSLEDAETLAIDLAAADGFDMEDAQEVMVEYVR